MNEESVKPLLASVSRDWLRCPFFPPTVHQPMRLVRGGAFDYEIGGFHPRIPGLQPPPYDIRHGMLILAILSLRRNPSERWVSFSLNELCFRYASSNGGMYARNILRLLQDLENIHVRVNELATKSSFVFHILDRCEVQGRPIRRKDDHRVGSKQQEFWFHGVQLSEEFCKLLELTGLQNIRFDQLKKLDHKLSRSLYMFIPAQAFNGSVSNPARISLTNLLKKMDLPVPRKLSERKRLFTREGKTSVIGELDKTETLSAVLRVRLALTQDGSDYNLESWLEKRKEPSPVIGQKMGELHAIFLEQGGTEALYEKRLKRRRTLDSYQIGCLQDAHVDTSKCIDFLELAQALLGTEAFNVALAEVADCVRTDRVIDGSPIKNPTGFLINYLTRSLKRTSLEEAPAPVPSTAPATRPQPVHRASPAAGVKEPDEARKVQAYLASLSREERLELERQVKEEANEFERAVLEKRDSFLHDLVAHRVRTKLLSQR